MGAGHSSSGGRVESQLPVIEFRGGFNLEWRRSSANKGNSLTTVKEAFAFAYTYADKFGIARDQYRVVHQGVVYLVPPVDAVVHIGTQGGEVMFEATGFVTKDSGERAQLAGGMVRDTTEGKEDWTLIFDGPLAKRWMELLGRGAIKYKKRNWMLALAAKSKKAREETKERFKESAMRHHMQWFLGDRTEDHAAAVVFNLNGYEAMLETDHLGTEE
jgi:dATP/dGTP diphosphohydrolase